VVNLQSPNVFHNLISLSQPPERICLLSGEKATVMTSELCPGICLRHFAYLKSQSLRVLSQLEEIAYTESEDNAMSEMKWLCPMRLLNGYPYNFYLLTSFSTPCDCSGLIYHIIKDLSRDPETKRGVSFAFLPGAIPATILVTWELCPIRSPTYVNSISVFFSHKIF